MDLSSRVPNRLVRPRPRAGAFSRLGILVVAGLVAAGTLVGWQSTAIAQTAYTSRIVVLGDSILAGFASGGLVRRGKMGQRDSAPALIARQAHVKIPQPLMTPPGFPPPLVIHDRNILVVVAQVDGPGYWNVSIRVGSRISLVNTGMGLPPVVVGLFVTILLWRNGLFGFLELLYTPGAMVLAQLVIAAPIVTSATVETVASRRPVTMPGSASGNSTCQSRPNRP